MTFLLFLMILSSPPSRGAWIEMSWWPMCRPAVMSPPSRGAWIEIEIASQPILLLTSPPSRGAWIEIDKVYSDYTTG